MEEISLKTEEIIEKLPGLYKKGLTEFSLEDTKASCDKKFLFRLFDTVRNDCPDLFLSLPINIQDIDRDFLAKAEGLYLSLEIPLETGFNKKTFSTKEKLLNDSGLVFGFILDWGLKKEDTFQSFRSRLDYAVSAYPNHILFPQFESGERAKSTGIYSSKDLDFSKGMAFACRTFYTEGRAVPWFNSVLKPLKISPSSFFADFDEWQQCNNCSFITDYCPEDAEQEEIEKMQLNFLQQKYEEKNKSQLFAAASDLVKLNGAFSRVAKEGKESIVETSYTPDDILTPYSSDLAKFFEAVAMEPCKVKVFAGLDSPDYKIL